jgi:hypothetical protein
MAWCRQNHRSNPIFRGLPFSEEFFGLHRRWHCAGCAYNQGYEDGVAGRPHNPDLAVLDQSQAQEVRHKNPIVAYEWGYTDAVNGIPRRSI